MAKKVSSSERIREIMHERGLRQTDVINLAQPFCREYDIKFQKSTLSQYLKGEYEPGQDKLFILGLVFDVNEAWLMGFDVPKERGEYLTFPESDPSERLWELEHKLKKMIQRTADQYVDLFINIIDQKVQLDESAVILTPAEHTLIQDYRELTPPGQEYIRQTMTMAKMSYSEKSNSSSNVEIVE